ncbi:hypothetical protein OUZ56_008107 [Daphnia magna]|uniref:Uncharacterized protein n=1 Tax=Daphnia magna TaxID=35525 RepID=A0ABR0AC15_9CRUS|nr:hypothetical protein OUZ56_008107 [Daphnia magna]
MDVGDFINTSSVNGPLVVLVVAVRTCDMDRNNVDRLLCCLCPLAINMVAVKVRWTNPCSAAAQVCLLLNPARDKTNPHSGRQNKKWILLPLPGNWVEVTGDTFSDNRIWP